MQHLTHQVCELPTIIENGRTDANSKEIEQKQKTKFKKKKRMCAISKYLAATVDIPSTAQSRLKMIAAIFVFDKSETTAGMPAIFWVYIFGVIYALK